MRAATAPATLASAALALGLLPIGSAAAQAQDSAIRIPAMPLDRALLALARRTGRNILFRPQDLAGLSSRAVDAPDFDRALAQMLNGLPVRIVHQSAGIALAPARPHRPRPMPPRAHAPPPPPPVTQATTPIIVIGTHEAASVAESDPADALPLSDVLGAEGDSPAARNLAEAMDRVPGVLALLTNLQGALGGNDRAARAEGQHVAVRGLGGNYSQATIDGIALPQSIPYGRDPQLGMLPAFGFGSVQVDKTPGPDDVGDAIAAIIDVRSPSALGSGASGLALVGAAGLDGNALRYGQPARDWRAGLHYARRFGRLGFAVSAQVALRDFAGSEQTYEQGSMEFAVVDADGRSPAGIDPARNLLLTSVNAQFTRGTTRNANLLSALDFAASPELTLFARLAYAGSWTRQDVFQLGFHGGNSSDEVSRTAIGNGLYALSSSGGTIHYWYETNPEASHFLIGQTGLAWTSGRTTLKARTWLGSGVTSRPDHIETSFWSTDASALPSGLTVGYAGGYPVPRLSAADAATAAAVLTYPVHLQADFSRQSSKDRRAGGEISLRREGDGGALDWVEIGTSLLHSRRSGSLTDIVYSNLFAEGTTLGASGLVAGSIDAILPGIYDYALPLVSRAALLARIGSATPPAQDADAVNGQSFAMRETGLAGWLRARFRLGPVTLTPGLRLDDSRTDARYWVAGNNGIDADGVQYGWNTSRSTFLALLPGLALAWAPARRQMVRLHLWASQTRPAAGQLAGSTTLETSSSGELQLVRGNPDLRPVRAANLDLSWEWKAADGAQIAATIFAKRLTHYIYDAGSDYANARETDEGGLTVIEPTNGGTARILGLEASARLPLGRMADVLAPLTFQLQAGLLRGRVHLRNPLLDPVEHLQYAPNYNVTSGFEWRHGNWRAEASLRLTGAYIQRYGLFGASASGYSQLNGSALDVWVRPSRQLDLGLTRQVGSGTKVQLFLRNALADVACRSTIGRHSGTIPQTIDAGRTLALRIDHAF